MTTQVQLNIFDEYFCEDASGQAMTTTPTPVKAAQDDRLELFRRRKSFTHGDIGALDGLELPSFGTMKQFMEDYAPRTVRDILLSDYLLLIDGRLVEAIIQPSKNKDMADYIGFDRDDSNVYIRSFQEEGCSYRPAYNMGLKTPSCRDLWEREPLPNCKNVKEGMKYLYKLATCLETCKELVRPAFERAALIAKQTEVRAKEDCSAITPVTSTLVFEPLIKDEDIIDISSFTREQIITQIESDPRGISLLSTIGDIERKFGIHYSSMNDVTRNELKSACLIRSYVVRAKQYVNDNFVKRTDLMTVQELESWISRLDESYELTDGCSRYITEGQLLPAEYQQCRDSEDFEAKYAEIKSSLEVES